MATNTPLQSILLTSSVTSVVFSNIDQNYTDLRIVINGKSSTADTVTIRLNGDSSSSYTRVSMAGNGSATQSNTGGPISYGVCNTYGYMDASNFGYILTLDIHNYSNTSNYKTILCKSGNSGNGLSLLTNLWAKTAAITSITLFTDSGYSYTAGTTFDLYGIKSGAPKAFGGDVVATDGNYWYHAFKSTGTFIPQYPISCDVLLVAGGGGGGNGGGAGGGGGGAGGVRVITQAISSAQTITIGAGGTGATLYASTPTSGGNSSFGSSSSTGGGYGGTYSTSNLGATGGSGGGVTGNDSTAFTGASGNAGSYSPVEGFKGGNTPLMANPNGSGGGGASAVGVNATNGAAGAGGAGTDTYNSINFSGWLTATSTGSSTKVGGGGGGAGYIGISGGAGGAGGGGTGETRGSAGQTVGVTNTGGGGGGAALDASGGAKNGGSGLIIVRYAV